MEETFGIQARKNVWEISLTYTYWKQRDHLWTANKWKAKFAESPDHQHAEKARKRRNIIDILNAVGTEENLKPL